MYCIRRGEDTRLFHQSFPGGQRRETVDKLKLSIALCTYNGAAFLPEQLASFISQTRLPDELVVCDDRSEDETIKLIEEFAAKSPFPVRLYENERTLGSNDNFAKAIGLCTGDIIFLSDQDDVWLPQKLAKMERLFADHPEIDGVFTDATMVDERLQPLGYTFWQSKHFNRARQKRFTEGDAAGILAERNTVAGAAFAFRARCNDGILPIPPVWTHDSWIAFYLASTARLAIVDECLNLYRQHGAQQVGSEMKDFSTRVAEAREDDSSAAEKLARGKYEQARERLAAVKTPPDPRGLDRLEQKMNHFQARQGPVAAKMAPTADRGKRAGEIPLSPVFQRFSKRCEGPDATLKKTYFLPWMRPLGC